jgi:undecaprenyl pyrophosphate synthase
MNTKRSRFHGLFTDDQEVLKSRNQEILEVSNQETKKPRKEETAPAMPTRIKTNYEIRADLAQALKRHAVEHQRKIYEVLEDAISEYLERQRKA